MISPVAEEPVQVEITEARTDARRHVSHIAFQIRNTGDRPVWLVVDPWFIWRRGDGRVTISFARGRMRPGVEAFGYFDPEVSKLDPQASIDKTLDIAWPLELSTIWNHERTVWPEAGHYRIRIEVGFGSTPSPPEPEGADVEQAVLNWQHTAVSTESVLEVPPP